jgi:biotin operon repressor
MDTILIFVLGVVVGVVVSYFYAQFSWCKCSEGQCREQAPEGGMADKFIGICEYAFETSNQKEERKKKIVDFLKEEEKSNSQIREALGVSSRTVVRYLDELEREGQVEQIGKVGHTVTYRFK